MTTIRKELNRLNWLKTRRRQSCPDCKSTTFPYSLIQTTQWCSDCGRVWKYVYCNPENSIKHAMRYWWHEENPKVKHRV